MQPLNALVSTTSPVSVFSSQGALSCPQEMMTNWQHKARIALAQYERFQDDEPDSPTPDELVALGAANAYVEAHNKNRHGSPTSPSAAQSPDDRLTYNSQTDIMSTTTRDLPTSPTDGYPSSHQAHANYAAQWLQQQAYFPPPPPGSDGREASDTPSSSGIEFSSTMDHTEWPQSFMP